MGRFEIASVNLALLVASSDNGLTSCGSARSGWRQGGRTMCHRSLRHQQANGGNQSTHLPCNREVTYLSGDRIGMGATSTVLFWAGRRSLRSWGRGEAKPSWGAGAKPRFLPFPPHP